MVRNKVIYFSHLTYKIASDGSVTSLVHLCDWSKYSKQHCYQVAIVLTTFPLSFLNSIRVFKAADIFLSSAISVCTRLCVFHESYLLQFLYKQITFVPLFIYPIHNEIKFKTAAESSRCLTTTSLG